MKKDELITNNHPQEEDESLEEGRDTEVLIANDGHNVDDLIQKLTFLENLGSVERPNSFHKIKIPRYQLIGKAAGLSLVFTFSEMFTGVAGIIFLSMFLQRQENAVKIDHSSRAMDEADRLQDSAVMFIATMSLILLMHSLEKWDINSARRTGSQARCSFFRRKINDYPIPAFLFTQLLLSLTDKAFVEKRSKISMSELSIIGVSGLGALYAIFKVLKEDHLRLSYCVNLLGGFMSKLHEKTSPCIERSQNGISHVFETVKPSLLRCMNKIVVVSKPYVDDIESYWNESTVDSHHFVPGKMG